MTNEKFKRVTEILYPFSGLDKINQEIVVKAGIRGTKVHKICEGIIKGLGEVGVDEETLPYIESFKQWWKDGYEVVEVEKRFYDKENLITGQCDLIIKEGESLTIVDFKTSYKPSKTWQPQGCAYAYLARKEGYDIKQIKFLHLSKFGKPPKIHTYEVDDEFFLKIYQVYCYFYS